MPTKPARRCVRCRALISGRQCPTCHAPWINQPRSWIDGDDARWRKVRADQLAAFPSCAWCGAEANVADHLDGTDYTTQRYDRTMLRSLCTPCHHKRTAQQSVAARKRMRDG